MPSFRKGLRKYHACILVGLALIALALTFLKWEKSLAFAWDPHSMGTAIAELLIAAVIYYEIEENRIADFLREVQTKETYLQRGDLYVAYLTMPGKSIREKAEAFSSKLQRDEVLRKIADYQLVYFSRINVLAQGSFFHRNLVSDWFPQVAIRMWAMLGQYVADCDKLGLRAARELAEDVIASVERLQGDGITGLTIHGAAFEDRVPISTDDFEQLKESARNYLKESRFV